MTTAKNRGPVEAGCDPSRAGLPLWPWAVVLALALAANLPEGLMPDCLFRRLSGHPCPTCGLLSTLRQLLHGHIRAAWDAQAGMVAALGMILAGLVAGTGVTGRIRVAGMRPRIAWGLWSAAAAWLVADWVLRECWPRL